MSKKVKIIIEFALIICVGVYLNAQFSLQHNRAYDEGRKRFEQAFTTEIKLLDMQGARSYCPQLFPNANLSSCSAIVRSCGDPNYYREIREDIGWQYQLKPELSLRARFAVLEDRASVFTASFNAALDQRQQSWDLASIVYRADDATKIKRLTEHGENAVGLWQRLQNMVGTSASLDKKSLRLLNLYQAEVNRNRDLASSERELKRYFYEQRTGRDDFLFSRFIQQVLGEIKKDIDANRDLIANKKIDALAMILNEKSPCFSDSLPGTTKAEIESAKRVVGRYLNSERYAQKSRDTLNILELLYSGLFIWCATWLAVLTLLRRFIIRPLYKSRPLPLVYTGFAMIGWLLIASIGNLFSGTQYWVGVFASSIFFVFGLIRWAKPKQAQAFECTEASSVLTLPVYFLLIGTGLLLLADQSLSFKYGLRFIALNHFANMLYALIVVSIIPAWAPYIFDRQYDFYSTTWGRLQRMTGRVKKMAFSLLLLLILIVLLVATEKFAPGDYFSGEAYKLLYLFGLSWLLVFRGASLNVDSIVKLFSQALPILLLFGSVAVFFIITNDLGPFLVISLTTIFTLIFIVRIKFSLPLLLGCLLALAGLVEFDLLPVRVFERFSLLSNPFGNENDHLAKLLWFQQGALPDGFGPGGAPWCGYGVGENSCAGLPGQLQSDYTFTGLIGVYGYKAMILPILLCFMLFGLVRRVAQDSDLSMYPLLKEGVRKSFESWFAILLSYTILFQTLISMLANIGYFPITGITLPFISYGLWSLISLTFCLALVMDRTYQLPMQKEG